MIDLKTYTKLKERADALQEEASRAKGSREQLLKQLKKEFNCGSVEDARELLATMQEEAETMEGEFRSSLAAFEKKWGEKLG